MTYVKTQHKDLCPITVCCYYYHWKFNSEAKPCYVPFIFPNTSFFYLLSEDLTDIRQTVKP